MRSLQTVRGTLLTQMLCLGLMTTFLGACGSSKDSSKDSPTPVTVPTPTPTPSPDPGAGGVVTFATVAPIIAANCAGSSCHSTGSKRGVFVGNQANVDANKSDIFREVNAGSMPPGGGLSTADKATLLKYTKQ